MEFNNRSFLYGDGFFETMRYEAGTIQLLSHHIERAKKTAEFLKIHWPIEWDDYFFKRLLYVNQEDAVVRITFLRMGGGNYVPEGNMLQFAVLTRPLKPEGMWLNHLSNNLTLLQIANQLPTIQAKIYREELKYAGNLAFIKSTSALFYSMAGAFLKESKADDLVLLNHHGRVCEGINSNIVIFLKGNWLTPDVSEGPISGVFLKHLSSFVSIQTSKLTIEEIENAEVCLFTNSVSGIRRFKLGS